MADAAASVAGEEDEVAGEVEASAGTTGEGAAEVAHVLIPKEKAER